MIDPRTEFETAVDVARDALAAYKADPTKDKFRTWRDASEVAIKWCRAARLGTGGDSAAEDEFDALLAG